MKKLRWLLPIISFMILLLFVYNLYTDATALKRDDLIRLHVLANSDSPEDQALKNNVRDRLLIEFGQAFKDAPTMEAARDLINQKLREFEDIAEGELDNRGHKYPVKAELGIYSFPTKAYGETVYPAGKYEALRVVIGEGQGANWWCVMFPPLCFVDISTGVARRPVEAVDSKTIASVSNESKNVTVKYTFKLAEWWKSIKDFFKG